MEGAEDRVILALVSGPGRRKLREIGRRLVEERLAACVNVTGPVSSVYRWREEVEEAEESLAILKSTAGRREAMEGRVRELHPYEEPEFLVFPVADGSESYLRWVVDAVAGPAGDRGPA